MSETKNKPIARSFLQDSFWLFVVNAIVAVFNFSLYTFAARTISDKLDLWTAINSLITVLLTLVGGMSAEIIKNSSKFSQENPLLPFEYYHFLRGKIFKITSVLLLLSPILIWPLGKLVNSDNWPLMLLTILYLMLVLITTLNNSLLLGLLMVGNYSASILLNTICRFVFTIIGLLLGWQVVALPVGFLFGGVLGFLLAEILINQNFRKLKANNTEIRTKNFEWKAEIQSFVKTGLVLFILNIFFNLTSIVSRNVFASSEDSNLFAVLAFFASIILFGSSIFLSGLVAHAARSTGRKIYLMSLAIVVLASVGIGIGFYFFGPFLLTMLNRTNYINQLPLILAYSFFIACYNIVYVSVQYLIAKNYTYIANFLLIPVGIMAVCLFLVRQGFFTFLNPNEVWQVVILNIFLAFLTAIFFVQKILRTKDIHF